MENTYFFKHKPIFGLDIGYSSVKVMQLEQHKKSCTVLGYGVTTFAEGAIENGVLKDPDELAKNIQSLFKSNITGSISTHRVAVSVPASKTFNRLVSLPAMKSGSISEAVMIEAEQYIPMPLNELYVDHMVIKQNKDTIELLAVAAPKKIVDSYLDLTRMLGLEAVAFEPTIASSARVFTRSEQSDVPTVLIDLGSLSSDITIYDGGLVVTGTVPGGGDSFSNAIAEKLGVTKQEAHIIKTKYGLGVSKKQKEITDSLRPVLDQLVREAKRMIRYYEERTSTQQKISQVVTIGGGANMPGLADFMTDQLRLPVRMSDPWQHLHFGKLQPPNTIEKSMYATAAGLALIDPKEAII